MDTSFLIAINSAVVALGIAIWVIIHSRERRSSKYFAIMVLGIAGWILTNYFSNFLRDYQVVLWMNKLIFVTTSFFGWGLVIFSNVFPEDQLPNKKLYAFISVSAFFVIAVSLSPYLVQDISFLNHISIISFGWGIYLYFVFLLGCIIFSFLTIFIKYFRAKTVLVKKTIRLLIGGFGLFVTLSVATNLFLPVFWKKFDLTNLAPLYGVLFTGVVAFAILKYRFLDVRIILTEMLTFIIWIFILFRVLSAETWDKRLLEGALLLLFIIFGILLIRSVHNEIKRREEVEALSKRLAKALRDIRAKNIHLQKLLKMRSEFLDIASHQLRTLLTAIPCSDPPNRRTTTRYPRLSF